jgi:ribosomal protein L31
MELTKKEQELVKKQDFRNKSMEIEKNILDHPESISGDAFEKMNPTKSTFADGQYIREIFMPAGQVITTKIHKKLHPFFVMSGKLSIVSEDGVIEIEAPYHGITKPGTKRVIYTHEDTVFITVHATQKTTIEEVVEEISTEDFNDPDIALK